MRVSQLLVAPSQARGDFGVTPSVCLICSRHSLGSERATCPPRPPPTPLSPQAWLLPPRACPAPCPRADTARQAGPADGRVTAHCSLSGHMSNPAAGPRPGWLGGGSLGLFQDFCHHPPKKRGGLCCPSEICRAGRPSQPCSPTHRTGPNWSQTQQCGPHFPPPPQSPGLLTKASARFCVSLPLVGAKPEWGPRWGSRCLLPGHLGTRVGCECGSRPSPRVGGGRCRHCPARARELQLGGRGPRRAPEAPEGRAVSEASRADPRPSGSAPGPAVGHRGR